MKTTGTTRAQSYWSDHTKLNHLFQPKGSCHNLCSLLNSLTASSLKQDFIVKTPSYWIWTTLGLHKSLKDSYPFVHNIHLSATLWKLKNTEIVRNAVSTVRRWPPLVYTNQWQIHTHLYITFIKCYVMEIAKYRDSKKCCE